MKTMIPEPDIIAHDVLDETINVLSKRYNIQPCGIGIDGKFEYLEISFQMFQSLTKARARIILFDCVNELLEKINSSEEIRPYLKNYPFDYKNVGIIFFIRGENKEDLFHPDICVARCSTSGVIFRTRDPENTFKYKNSCEETHEEALAIINEQKQKIAQQNPNE